MCTPRRTGMIGGIVMLGILSVLLPRHPKPVRLAERSMKVDADPEHVYQQLASLDEGPKIVERNAHRIIAEFPIRVGWYRVTTLEQVTLDPNQRQVKFEQLRSPFFSVRTATEVFEVSDSPSSGAVITLHGVLWPRLGLLGWLVTEHVVRPRWDAIDAAFLARVRARVQSMRV